MWVSGVLLDYLLPASCQEGTTPIFLKHLWASDAPPCCRNLISVNYSPLGSRIWQDINTRPIDRDTPLYIYIAGPPCHGFSSEGLHGMWNDPRSKVYFQAIKTINASQPRIALTENSSLLSAPDDGLILADICTELVDNGYNVYPTKANTKQYALPTKRERSYLVCTRKKPTAQI